MKHRKYGFTLIEMSVVLLILALAAAGGLALYSETRDNDNLRITRERMGKILRMTELYVLRFGHLPCPAGMITQPNDTTNNRSYGQMAGIPGTCTDTAAYGLASEAGNVYMGAVPVAALGLSHDYMLDGWDRRLAYVVDEELTNDLTGTLNATIVDVNGDSLVKDGEGGDLSPAVIVISFGRNGFGAVPFKTAAATLAAAKMGDGRPSDERSMEDDNSHVDTAFDATFRVMPPREAEGSDVGDGSASERSDQIFDDILMWRTLADLANATNE